MVCGGFCSNDPCREVLQEQIWRRYPVNKEPAETSCERLLSEMCDFEQGRAPPRPLARRLVICIALPLFIVIECDTDGKLEGFS